MYGRSRHRRSDQITVHTIVFVHTSALYPPHLPSSFAHIFTTVLRFIHRRRKRRLPKQPQATLPQSATGESSITTNSVRLLPLLEVGWRRTSEDSTAKDQRCKRLWSLRFLWLSQNLGRLARSPTSHDFVLLSSPERIHRREWKKKGRRRSAPK